jgi:YqaJ-like viral recombinase domain.
MRAGIPTASPFDRILTPGGKKNEPKRSASAEKYMLDLLAERIMGHPITKYVSFWMERGSEMEAEALRFYEFQRDIDTVPAGFITNDKGDRGASPDRFVGSDGLMEIKCPSEGEHVSYLLRTGSHYDSYKVQVQGQLLICEREWTDVLSYHPELPMALARIHRDETFIGLLQKELDLFCDDLRKLEERAMEMGLFSGTDLGATSRAGSTQSAQSSILDQMRESLIAVQSQQGTSASP